MPTSTHWQVAHDTAERYEAVLVPSILGPVAKALVDAVVPRRGEHVVDVGTGTGAAARCAARRVGAAGRVTGVDVNAGMLAVAQSVPAEVADGAPIEWREASALELPVPDGEADIVLMSQVLQFVPDRPAALAEARRALRPAGRLAVGLWSTLEDNPYFHALVDSCIRHLGNDVADGLRSAFALSDAVAIRALIAAAGFRDVTSSVSRLDITLPPVTEFVPLHVAATPMAPAFAAAPDAARAAIVRDMDERLADFRADDALRVPFRSHVAIGIR